MIHLPTFIETLRKDNRLLRIHNETLKRSHLAQKEKTNQLEEENKKLREKIVQLEKELEKTKTERDSYKNLTFKEKRVCSSAFSHAPCGRKRGGGKGHIGKSRITPKDIHQHIRVYLTNCPDCGGKLNRVDGVTTHTITDLPHWQHMQPVTTQYQIERQWCKTCQKEVKSVPKGVIPGARFGSVLITMTLVWKYRFREPLGKIAERFSSTQYGVTISTGGIQRILSNARKWLGPKYDALINDVRGSPVKHADETSWTVGSEDYWAWAFVDEKTTVYAIEESRGGGVAKAMLEKALGILVRDDYSAYSALPLPQQSCWAHLLRKSHEASRRQEASDEVKKLHRKLVTIFELLAEDAATAYERRQREEWHDAYWQDLQKIINTSFYHADSKRIQTRITNQGKNLLTALLYPDVPLTNNLAERAIMPLVLTRKISRGSKTPTGAQTQAVNMSIIETIVKRKQPLLDTLHSYLMQGYTEKR